MTKSSETKKTPITGTPGQSGGVTIQARDVKVGGDVVAGNKTVTSQETGGQASPPAAATHEPVVRSAWANGLFYLFVFVVVAGVVAWIAGSLDPLALGIVVIAGLIAVPLIGALQLSMDKRLSQKTFLELMRLVIRQLPLIGGFAKSR